VFAVLRDGTLVTPPEADGILLGITRQTVLAVAAELGIPTRLESLPLEIVKSAAEVFVSSSIRELVPVISVDGTPIGDGKPGPTTLRLLGAFREACRRSVIP
jgi:branched-chain amino acid aminotransferase